ncbi:MAG: hypothetical protein AAFU55_03910 [Pseudomonadota bacterium]
MNSLKVLILAGFATGCTGVTSAPPSVEDMPSGLAYFLPSSLLPVTISVKEDGMTMTASALEYIPDERHGYVLKHVYSPAHGDEMTFEVSNGLLSSIDLKSDGRLDEIIVAAAKSALVFENMSAKPTAVYSDKLRIDRLISAEKDAEGMTALDRLRTRIQSNIDQELPTARTFDIKVEREFPDADIPSASPEDCAVGFCYRVPVSYIMRVTYGGQTQTARFMAPNDSPTLAAPVDRGLFTQWDTVATLTNGMLTKYQKTATGSELESLVSLPTQIIAAEIEGLQLSGQRLQAELDLERKRLDIEKARLEIEKERRALDGPTPESAPGGGANQFLFQLSFGEGAVAPEFFNGLPRLGASSGSPGEDADQKGGDDDVETKDGKGAPRELSGSNG